LIGVKILKKTFNLLCIFLVGLGFMCLPIFDNVTQYSLIGDNFIEILVAIFYFLGLALVVLFGPLLVIKVIREVCKNEDEL